MKQFFTLLALTISFSMNAQVQHSETDPSGPVASAIGYKTTASGIIIPDSAKEKPLRGKVVAAGTGKPDEPMTVKVGDDVLYGQYSGTEIKLNGATYLIMREADIYGIF